MWNEHIWRRSPHVQKLNIGLSENNELLWLFEVEEAVLMVEVKPGAEESLTKHTIGQVVLKRLITAEQAIGKLSQTGLILQPQAQEAELKTNP